MCGTLCHLLSVLVLYIVLSILQNGLISNNFLSVTSMSHVLYVLYVCV